MATQLSISDLIHDVLIKIFDQVALQDLLFSVPMVCRRWNAVVPQVCRRKKKLYLYPDTDIYYSQVDSMHFLEMAPSWASSSNLLVLDQENNKPALLDKFDRIEELSIYNYPHIGSIRLKWSSTLVTLKIYFDVRCDSCPRSERFFKQLYVNGQFLLPKLKSLSIRVNERNLVYVPLALITGQLEVFNLYIGFGWTYGQDIEHLIAIIKHIDQVSPASLTLKHFGYSGSELSDFHVNLKRANLLEARIPLKRLSLVSGPILHKEELADICRHYPSISYLSLKICGPFRMKEVLTVIKPLRHCLRRLKIILSLRHGCGGIEEVWAKHRKSLSAFKFLFELVQSVRLVTKEGYVSSIRDFYKECSNVGATADHPLFSEISRIFPKAMFYTGF